MLVGKDRLRHGMRDLDLEESSGGHCLPVGDPEPDTAPVGRGVKGWSD